MGRAGVGTTRPLLLFRFVFWQNWGLNFGALCYQAGDLPLEPLHRNQACLVSFSNSWKGNHLPKIFLRSHLHPLGNSQRSSNLQVISSTALLKSSFNFYKGLVSQHHYQPDLPQQSSKSPLNLRAETVPFSRTEPSWMKVGPPWEIASTKSKVFIVEQTQNQTPTATNCHIK
jgi:hypothetical protein